MPDQIEKQTELHPRVEGIDWSTLNVPKVEFTIGDKRSDEDTVRSASEGFKQELTPLQARDLFARAIHKGFDLSLLHTNDVVRFEDNVLYITTNDKKFAMKMTDDAKIDEGYEELESKIVKKSRRAWMSLDEAVQHGILTEILAAHEGGNWKAASYKNRARLWEKYKDEIDTDSVKDVDDPEKYRGSRDQNHAFVEFLKGKFDAGEELELVQPGEASKDTGPAPVKEAAERPRKRREKKEREKGKIPEAVRGVEVARSPALQQIPGHPNYFQNELAADFARNNGIPDDAHVIVGASADGKSFLLIAPSKKTHFKIFPGYNGYEVRDISKTGSASYILNYLGEGTERATVPQDKLWKAIQAYEIKGKPLDTSLEIDRLAP